MREIIRREKPVCAFVRAVYIFVITAVTWNRYLRYMSSAGEKPPTNRAKRRKEGNNVLIYKRFEMIGALWATAKTNNRQNEKLSKLESWWKKGELYAPPNHATSKSYKRRNNLRRSCEILNVENRYERKYSQAVMLNFWSWVFYGDMFRLEDGAFYPLTLALCTDDENPFLYPLLYAVIIVTYIYRSRTIRSLSNIPQILTMVNFLSIFTLI